MAIPLRIGSGVADSFFGKSQEHIHFMLEQHAQAWEKKSMIEEIFCMEKSTHYAEKYTSAVDEGDFRAVGESGDYPIAGLREGYSKVLENVTWKRSFIVSREMVDDSRTFDLNQRPANFIKRFYLTRENFAAALLGNAIHGTAKFKFTDTYFDSMSADGKVLFDKEHPGLISKKKQSNRFADPFSKAALGAVESKMHDFRDDDDQILAVAPTTIIIPDDSIIIDTVFETIGSDKDPDTSRNGFNYHCGRWHVIIWPYLNKFVDEGHSPWILFDPSYNEECRSAVWQDREELNCTSRIADNDDNVWQGRARFTAGFNDWRAFAVGGVSGGTALVG